MPSGSIDSSHPTLSSLSVLDRAKADQVVALCELCENHDGVAPLNEQALLTLNDGKIHDGIAHVVAEIDGQIVAYALLDSAIPDPQLGALSVAQFMVHPQHRRRGIAWQMAGSLGFDVRPEADADQAERHRAGLLISAWSFGNLPSARTWAEKYGAAPVRQLLIMRRPAAEVPAPRFDAGFTVRPFVEADMAQMLEVNALAFAHHPEQGQMSADDVRARMSEDWFDPEGFLVLEHQERVIGFHWTKQHSAQRGEVYVIGIHPEWSGRGLGRHLLNAGMQHLAQRGVDEIILYVEGDLEHVVRLYRTSGFEIINTDVLYRTTNRT
ncbi:mycothiol synthase [Propioniferax innocua]|uniref:Mycothiol acetyltransferase n=1 Tax=Propioniferax innocua TaxID=1753 RepID=A0A542ZCI8_9ACTN|nr:mycothiol synthase [Propioniferax innocua]TQL58073.1 mycothiol synthase [Propioniferax innocua]